MRVLILCLTLTASARADDWRPYLFSISGDTQAAKHAALEHGLGYNGVTGTGGGLQPDASHRVQTWLGYAVGITNWLEASGGLQFADNLGQNFGFSQARVDFRARPLAPRLRVPLALSIGVGYQADALLHHAITAVVAFSAYLGRFNLTLNLRGAHYFAPGRDPVDIFVTFGALVRATHWLHAGLEYVGEELEAAFDEEEADVGGAGRHYLGPTAVLRFWENRIRVNVTVGAVFMSHRDFRGAEPILDVGPLARASMAYLF
jgi:hypothetical protein